MSSAHSPNTTDRGRENAVLADYLELLRDPSDKLLASALRSGAFRLAVQCTACGTWLVAESSVRRHLGPVCARRTEATTQPVVS